MTGSIPAKLDSVHTPMTKGGSQAALCANDERIDGSRSIASGPATAVGPRRHHSEWAANWQDPGANNLAKPKFVMTSSQQLASPATWVAGNWGRTPRKKSPEKMLLRRLAARAAQPRPLPRTRRNLPTPAGLLDLAVDPGKGISLNLRLQPRSKSQGEGISPNPKLAAAEAQTVLNGFDEYIAMKL